MKLVVRYFLQGCLVLFPVAGTVYVVWLVLSFVDRLVPVAIPGLGILLSVAVITLVGAIASNVVGKRIVGGVEAVMSRVPLVRLLYGSIRDLVGAFVGDKRGFGRPAVVHLDGPIRVLGFVTSDVVPAPLPGHVAVYLPQSYNFAGNLIVVPLDRVELVDADPTRFLAFIVSGGVSGRG